MGPERRQRTVAPDAVPSDDRRLRFQEGRRQRADLRRDERLSGLDEDHLRPVNRNGPPGGGPSIVTLPSFSLPRASSASRPASLPRPSSSPRASWQPLSSSAFPPRRRAFRLP